jgi:hypothetical protein
MYGSAHEGGSRCARRSSCRNWYAIPEIRSKPAVAAQSRKPARQPPGRAASRHHGRIPHRPVLHRQQKRPPRPPIFMHQPAQTLRSLIDMRSVTQIDLPAREDGSQDRRDSQPDRVPVVQPDPGSEQTPAPRASTRWLNPRLRGIRKLSPCPPIRVSRSRAAVTTPRSRCRQRNTPRDPLRHGHERR